MHSCYIRVPLVPFVAWQKALYIAVCLDHLALIMITNVARGLPLVDNAFGVCFA